MTDRCQGCGTRKRAVHFSEAHGRVECLSCHLAGGGVPVVQASLAEQARELVDVAGSHGRRHSDG